MKIGDVSTIATYEVRKGGNKGSQFDILDTYVERAANGFLEIPIEGTEDEVKVGSLRSYLANHPLVQSGAVKYACARKEVNLIVIHLRPME